MEGKEEKLLSVPQFARRVNKAPSTIYMMMSCKEIKTVKVTRRNSTVNKIPESEVAKFKKT